MNKENIGLSLTTLTWTTLVGALIVEHYSQIMYWILMGICGVCIVADLIGSIVNWRRNKTKTVIKTNIPDISNNDRKQSEKIAEKLYQLLEITQKMDYPVKSIRAKEGNLTVEVYITKNSNEEKRPD